MSEDMDPIIKAALDSGEWVMKEHNGRTYYKNKKTKEKTWHLESLLKKIKKDKKDKKSRKKDSGDVTEDSETVKGREEEEKINKLRNERMQNTKQRTEEEEKMQAEVVKLEERKAALEKEVQQLRPPITQQKKQVAVMQATIKEMANSLVIVESEAAEKQAKKSNDLKTLHERLNALKTVVEVEQANRTAVENRYKALVTESYDLKAEVSKELATIEALKLTVADSQKQAESLRRDIERQQSEMAMKEEELAQCEATLLSFTKQRTDLTSAISEASLARESILKHIAEFEQGVRGDKDRGADRESLLAVLKKRHDDKLAQWEKLTVELSERDECRRLEQQNVRQRTCFNDSLHDKKVLAQMTGTLRAEIQRLHSVTQLYRRELMSLRSTIVSNV